MADMMMRARRGDHKLSSPDTSGNGSPTGYAAWTRFGALLNVDREQAIAGFEPPVSGPTAFDAGHKPSAVCGPGNPPRRLERTVVSNRNRERHDDRERETCATGNHDPEERRPRPPEVVGKCGDYTRAMLS